MSSFEAFIKSIENKNASNFHSFFKSMVFIALMFSYNPLIQVT